MEDEFAIADALAWDLSMLDAKIVGYAPSAALKIISSGASPDLALVDIRLSDGSGEDLVQELTGRGVEVILSTALDPSQVPDSLQGLRCLTKPYAPTRFFAELHRGAYVRRAVHRPLGESAGAHTHLSSSSFLC